MGLGASKDNNDYSVSNKNDNNDDNDNNNNNGLNEDKGEEERKNQIGREIILHKGRRVKFDMLIASGGFSQVYLVNDMQSKERFAIKRIICNSAQEEDAVLREIITHKLLGGDAPISPYIMPLYDSKIQEMYKIKSNQQCKEAFLLQPLMIGGSLQDIILIYPTTTTNTQKKKGEKNSNITKMELKDILRVFYCICEAVKTMHEVGISHRDIKPHNIIFQDYFKSSLKQNKNNVPVLIDFGSSVGPPLIQKVESRNQALLVQDKAEATMSAAFRAPEFYDVPSQCSLDGGKSDVFSLGCVLFAMCYYGYSPFEHPTQGISTLAARCATFHFPDEINQDDSKPSQMESKLVHLYRINDDIKKLIRVMLSLKPEERPSSSELVEKTLSILNKLENPNQTSSSNENENEELSKSASLSNKSTNPNSNNNITNNATFFDTEFTAGFPSES